MSRTARLVPLLILPCWLTLSLLAQEVITVRVATYNIKFLSVERLNRPNQQGRREKIRQVIELLDADVIALQEIHDRAALREIFSEDDWILIIDDDSGDDQDVGVAVRKPFFVSGFDPGDFDADEEDFLFPNESNVFFPNKRDVLSVKIDIPDSEETFYVMVVHTKSRFERDPNKGRATNDFRREGASNRLITKLDQDFHDDFFILLGDFNDNPDDRSLNILETGDPNAAGGPEENQGPFLINLTEPLVVSDQVSHGRNSLDIQGGQINTIDPGSRQSNNDGRGTNENTGDILFDQILISANMLNRYVGDSAAVFNASVAAQGNSNNRASDHLPVFAEFTFFTGSGGEPPEGVQIVSALADPNGPDAGNEQVSLHNFGSEDIDLTGWNLRDRAGNEYALKGEIPAGQDLLITMTEFSMPLNNSGDDIILLNSQDVLQHQITYSGDQVMRGVTIIFE